ncbi:MAG TPA: hypothetical protein VN281_02470 [Verrucomicrobiae bacterium]|nr:hypothetical protein [Verrucomicrobiae bacterium]
MSLPIGVFFDPHQVRPAKVRNQNATESRDAGPVNFIGWFGRIRF